MEKTSEFLIYLMACSLQGTKPEEALLANIDMEALLRLAKAHSVSGGVHGAGADRCVPARR